MQKWNFAIIVIIYMSFVACVCLKLNNEKMRDEIEQVTN